MQFIQSDKNIQMSCNEFTYIEVFCYMKISFA